MLCFVSRYQIKIVGKWCCVYELRCVVLCFDFVSCFLIVLFDVLYDGIKHNKENYTGVWITLENSLLELNTLVFQSGVTTLPSSLEYRSMM